MNLPTHLILASLCSRSAALLRTIPSARPLSLMRLCEVLISGRRSGSGVCVIPIRWGAYGGSFNAWLHSENPQPYNSFGNGAAMRVSPVGWAFNSEAETLRAALASAAPTHNHVEGLIGASVVARAIFQLRAMNRPSFLSGEVSALVAASYGEDWEYYLPARGVFDETCQDVSLSRSTFALFPRASSQPFAGQSCGVAIRTLSQRSSAHLPRLVGASLPKSGRRLCRCSLLIWLTLL